LAPKLQLFRYGLKGNHSHQIWEQVMRRPFFGFLLTVVFALPMHAAASDPFVRRLVPCLEFFKGEALDPRYQVVLGQGWTVSLFEVAKEDGGNLGSDLCGDLDASDWDTNGAYLWPERLGEMGEGDAVNLNMITPLWLGLIIDGARAVEKTRAPIQRITITGLPEPGAVLVRVQFAALEAQAEAPASVDLNQQGEVLARETRVPDQLARAPIEVEARAQPAESVSAPTIDPQNALALLLGATKAEPSAQIIRLTLSSFSAGLVYRNGPNAPIRQTEFNFIDAQASGLSDAEFEFPSAFKACNMRLQQVKNALAKVILQKRYQSTATRLQHLLLECSDDKPKPHWSLVALEPFEYFDLPGQIE
jgi:hypothetical protein